MEERKLITRDSIVKLGFIEHHDNIFRRYFNNTMEYIDTIEINFNSDLSNDFDVILKQREIVSSDQYIESIFIRYIKYIDELNQLIQVLTGVENK